MDHCFVNNPFIDDNENNRSYRATSYYTKEFREFSIDYSDENVITNFAVDGFNKMVMIEHAYFNEKFEF